MRLFLAFFSFLILCTRTTSAQDGIGVLCVDFTVNGKANNKVKYFRPAFESIISNIENPPNLIERTKLSDLIQLIQYEKTLSFDVNKEIIDKLSSAKVNYVIYGDFSSPFTSEDYVFQFEIIKVSGDQIFSKKVSSPVRFSEAELASTSIFDSKMLPVIAKYSFISNVGLLEKDEFVEIKKLLDEKDRKISALEKKVNQIKGGDGFTIKFDGSHLSTGGGGTSMTVGTKESKIFQHLLALDGKGEFNTIIQFVDNYYRENPEAFWQTPKYFKALALITTPEKAEAGFKILDELISESPGDEDLMTIICITLTELKEEKRIQSFYDQLSPQMKYKIRMNVEKQLGQKK